MTAGKTKLIEPTEVLWETYLDLIDDYRQAGGNAFHYADEPTKDNFGEFVNKLRDYVHGVSLPDDWVPASTYWLVRDGRVLGTCNLRHKLTEALRDVGGHVGYSIRPSERNKGYATLMLKYALEKARQMGLRRVLVTCDKTNIASQRVIQKNGGVLESESFSKQADRVTQRYWIELEAGEDLQ